METNPGDDGGSCLSGGRQTNTKATIHVLELCCRLPLPDPLHGSASEAHRGDQSLGTTASLGIAHWSVSSSAGRRGRVVCVVYMMWIDTAVSTEPR